MSYRNSETITTMKTYIMELNTDTLGEAVFSMDIKANNLKEAKKIAQFNKRRLTSRDLGSIKASECRTSVWLRQINN